jgi:hypothetical protein
VRRAGILYLVVWLLVGTFFVASVYFADGAESWGREGRYVSGFVFVYALALAGGLPTQIIAALLVRWLTRRTGLNSVVHWLAFGAAVGVVLPWIVARLAYLLEGVRFAHQWQSVKSALMFPLMAAMMYEVNPAWVLAVVGAATAGTVRLLMFRIAEPEPRRATRGPRAA